MVTNNRPIQGVIGTLDDIKELTDGFNPFGCTDRFEIECNLSDMRYDEEGDNYNIPFSLKVRSET